MKIFTGMLHIVSLLQCYIISHFLKCDNRQFFWHSIVPYDLRITKHCSTWGSGVWITHYGFLKVSTKFDMCCLLFVVDQRMHQIWESNYTTKVGAKLVCASHRKRRSLQCCWLKSHWERENDRNSTYLWMDI